MIRIFILGLVLFPATALAGEVILVEQPSPFEISTLEEVTTERWLVGELDDFPQTFEFELTEPTVFRAQVMVPAETDVTNRISLIAIKEVERGVEEVMRRTATSETWEPFADPISGLEFIESTYYEDRLEPGVYRIEVSTPDNAGYYVLKLGTKEVSRGYFGTYRDIMNLRSGLGLSTAPTHMNVYVALPPLLIVTVVVGAWWFWRRRNSSQTSVGLTDSHSQT